MKAKQFIVALALSAFPLLASAAAENAPGVTATEIKIGATYPFSGPASAFGNSGKAIIAYVNYLNDQGGINGRKINLIALDDAYSPPKTVEQIRRLVESDEVAFIFSQLGTPTNAATIRYLTMKKVPHVFILSGASKFTDFKQYPYTTTAVPSYETEAKIYARYIIENNPTAKVALLYQNDDLGKDFLNGFKSVFGERFAERVVASSYEVSDPTVDSQIVNLKASAATVFMFGGSPKSAAQAIRKAREIVWNAQIFVNQISSSIATTLEPAGLENSIGIISSAYLKDVADPRYKDDPGVKNYIEIMNKYMPGADYKDMQYVAGVNYGMELEQLLKEAGNDLSRENILKVSRHMPRKEYPLLIKGITASTSDSSSQLVTELQLQKFNGKSYDPYGGIISASQGN